MKIAGYKQDSLVDGEGIRFVIFMTGCIHNCKGCHNPEMQDYEYGDDVTDEEIMYEIEKAMPFIQGITLSGGDPLYQLNNTKNFLKKFRKVEKFKKLDVWLYTGHLYEHIPKGLTQYCDVIIDGKYDETLPPAKYRGSNNQNVWVRFPQTNKFIKRIYDE
jgi:anaerobic ribonucleoside-triphosphate reductase activating protein